jgi:hypothetical protein
MDGTEMFNVDSTSTVLSNISDNIGKFGKPADKHNAGRVAFTDCANWAECVTWSVAGDVGVSASISCVVGTEG